MIDQPDLAIAMYKKLRMNDDLIRLLSKYHKDLVIDTHHHLAEVRQHYLPLLYFLFSYIHSYSLWKQATFSSCMLTIKLSTLVLNPDDVRDN